MAHFAPDSEIYLPFPINILTKAMEVRLTSSLIASLVSIIRLERYTRANTGFNWGLNIFQRTITRKILK